MCSINSMYFSSHYVLHLIPAFHSIISCTLGPLGYEPLNHLSHFPVIQQLTLVYYQRNKPASTSLLVNIITTVLPNLSQFFSVFFAFALDGPLPGNLWYDSRIPISLKPCPQFFATCSSLWSFGETSTLVWLGPARCFFSKSILGGSVGSLVCLEKAPSQRHCSTNFKNLSLSAASALGLLCF